MTNTDWAYRASGFFLAIAGGLAFLFRELGQGEGLWTAWLYIFVPGWFITAGLGLHHERQKAKRLKERGT